VVLLPSLSRHVPEFLTRGHCRDAHTVLGAGSGDRRSGALLNVKAVPRLHFREEEEEEEFIRQAGT